MQHTIFDDYQENFIEAKRQFHQQVTDFERRSGGIILMMIWFQCADFTEGERLKTIYEAQESFSEATESVS